MTESSLDIVYVLTNEAMPGLVKIGKTSQDRPETRVNQLYTTGVPVPFTIEYACRVVDAREVERVLHNAFDLQRINQNREFFEIEPHHVIGVLKLLSQEDVTEAVQSESSDVAEEDLKAAESLRRRRPSLDFHVMDIPNGSILESTRTDDTATVVNNKRVSFRDQESVSLTAATREMLNQDRDVRPVRFWTFNGKSLRDIYYETYESIE